MSNTSNCIIPPFEFNIFHLYLIIVFVLLLLTLFLIYNFFKFFKDPITKAVTAMMSIGFFLLVSFIIFIIFAIFLEENDNPPSAKYHQIHAAIKNTCYIDPERKNCPTNKEEIIRLYPETFGPLLANTEVTYEYNPEANHFTLIIRYKDLRYSGYTVALFDSKLTQSGNSSPSYGYGGLDFYDPQVMKCGDKYEIIDKPPFPGPWNRIN